MIDTAKISYEKYLKRSPDCRKCATKKPALRKKISKGWFKKGSSGFVGKHTEETKAHLSKISKGQWKPLCRKERYCLMTEVVGIG